MELLRGVSAANNFVLAIVQLLSSQLFNSRSRPGVVVVSNAARVQKPDHRHCRLLRPRRNGPRSRRAAEQRDELAPFQLIELHSVPASQGRIAGYRIDHSQSADILNLVNRWSAPLRRDIVKGDGLRKTPPARGLPCCRSCADHRSCNHFPAFSPSPRTRARDWADSPPRGARRC